MIKKNKGDSLMAITVNEVKKRCYSVNFKRNNVED